MALRQEDLGPAQGAALHQFPSWASAPGRSRAVASRRRRRVTGSLVILSAALLPAGGGESSGAPSPRDGRARFVLVAPGDTLWEIARERAPAGADLRAYVGALVELNELEGALVPGMRLKLPR